MSKWRFEPGHTAVEFSVRHMMVTNVRGHFKNVSGTLELEPAGPLPCKLEVTIDAKQIWSGEPERDAHLRSPDFLDVEHYPEIRFKGGEVKWAGQNDCVLTGELTIKGITRPVALEVQHLGQWQTPWWEGGVDTGPKTRAGFVGRTRINRHDFGVSWNSSLDRGGMVVGDVVEITIDAEAILEGD